MYSVMNVRQVFLSEAEYEFLKKLSERMVGGERRLYSVDELSKLTGISKSSIESLIRLLEEKGLVRIVRREREIYSLTSVARKYMEQGFPEERLVRKLQESGGELPVKSVQELMGGEAAIAIAHALRKKWIRLSSGKVELVVDPGEALAVERKYLEAIASNKPQALPRSVVEELKHRKLLSVERRAESLVEFLADPREIIAKSTVEIGALTKDLIVSGAWKRARLKSYDITASPPHIRMGRTNFFREFIDYIRELMRELGFIEVESPPIELEFWNYDVLYQPQFHPARQATDTFIVESPSRGTVGDASIIERVKKLHEVGDDESTGWQYSWSLERALRIILRSHTTAVSARVLAARPTPPFRYFTIGRVYRVEKIDANHLPEFHQVDGIASEDDVDLRWLLGFLSEFLERLGFAEYKFRPAYFPFTEPSIEGYVRIGGRWLEILGAGLFRPEVLRAVGVDYTVAAWGMGIERLAMALYGLNDIRQLYSYNASFVESIPIGWRVYAGAKV